MDSRDEELTIENVDERVEELSLVQVSQPPAMMPLARVARDLHSFYEEERRLKAIWERINSRAIALHAATVVENTDEQRFPGSFQTDGKAGPAKSRSDVGSLNSIPLRPRKLARASRRWSNLGAGLVAALLLIAILAWPAFALVRHTLGSQSAAKTATPQATGTSLSMKAYTCQFFTIQYPTDWTIANTTTSGVALQTVRFRPLAASSVEITVAALPSSKLSSAQLLHADPDVRRGSLVNTSTVTYHGMLWSVERVDLMSSLQAPLGTLEIAYSNQKAPYKIELSTPPDLFAKYSTVFNAMLSSFSPQTQAGGTATATATFPPTITPSPTQNVPGMKEYSNQYFRIQYPSGWVITSITTGNGYLQSVQFRPSAQSAVFVNVNAMYSSLLSGYLLLQLDPDVGLGALLSTSTITYHGIPWATDTVSVAGSAQTQPSKMEIAYSNQQAPYRIEFGAPPDQFAAYSSTFNDIFSSFYPAN